MLSASHSSAFCALRSPRQWHRAHPRVATHVLTRRPRASTEHRLVARRLLGESSRPQRLAVIEIRSHPRDLAAPKIEDLPHRRIDQSAAARSASLDAAESRTLPTRGPTSAAVRRDRRYPPGDRLPRRAQTPRRGRDRQPPPLRSGGSPTSPTSPQGSPVSPPRPRRIPIPRSDRSNAASGAKKPMYASRSWRFAASKRARVRSTRSGVVDSFDIAR
jgi:hypothetical protein